MIYYFLNGLFTYSDETKQYKFKGMGSNSSALNQMILSNGLIKVGRELHHQHLSDLLSVAGCCWCNSWITAINPNYNITKQLFIKCIYDNISSKSVWNRTMLPACPHFGVTHLSLMKGVIALHILSWNHIKLWGQLMQEPWFFTIKIVRYGITNHH